MSKKADSKKDNATHSAKDHNINDSRSENSKEDQKDVKPAKLPKDLQKQICKHGFPKGNVFEYAATQIAKFEKKHKAQKAAKIQEKLQDVKTFIKSKSPEKALADSTIQEDKKEKKEKTKKEDPKKK